MKGSLGLVDCFKRLQNHDRTVPLLRGRVYILNIINYIYFYFVLRNLKLKLEYKLAIGIIFASSLLSCIIVLWYHNRLFEPKDREVMKRIDYAVIFYVITSTWLAIDVHFLDCDFAVVYFLVHWLLTVIGALSSLIFNFHEGSKWLRVTFFNINGNMNLYVSYRLFKAGKYVELGHFIAGTTCFFLSGIFYAAKFPNLIPRIFEHHEFMHLIIVLGNYFSYKANLMIV